MKAIMTKYLRPTKYRGYRIVAYAPDNKRKYYPYPHEFKNLEEAHYQCACDYRDSLGWEGELAQGWTGKEFAHVFINEE